MANNFQLVVAKALAMVLGLAAGVAVASGAGRVTLNFNPDWKFIQADPAGASEPGHDDREWTSVSTPHTFNDTDTFDNWSLPGHKGEQEQWSGRTWYRKHFSLPETHRGKKVYLEFEAARQVAEVYLNGRHLGTSKSGFTPFGFDLTPHLKFGQPNLLAVMVDNRFMKDPSDVSPAGTGAKGPVKNLAQINQELSMRIPEKLEDLQGDQIPWNNPHWHPAHGGLYRNVRLHVTDPLHITLPLYSFLETVGPYAYASEITAGSARVTVEVPVRNDRPAAENVTVRVEILDADGRPALVLDGENTIAAGTGGTFKLSGLLAQPRLWDPEYPHLYRVLCELRANGATIDTLEIPLGVRTVRWDKDNGLFVNGRHVKLHGWGQKATNEWPGLGAAQPDWMHFYTMQLMREAGGNFVRWGHVPGGPASITAGDRLGIITLQPGVDGEHDTVRAAWQLRALTFRDLIVYFRNNPSIFIWEGGNQKVSEAHARELRGIMDQFDPHGQRAYAHRRADKVTAAFMDVGIGTEGGREIANLPVVEGEYNREESPRRVWDDASPPNFGYPEAKGQTYQLTSEQFAVNQVGHYVKKLGAREHAGGANWIFSDSTSGGRVAVEVARASGEVDGVRLPKEAYHVCAVMFRSDPQVHIIGHWTYPVGTKKPIYVASNAEKVELFVNGKSLGFGKVSDRFLFTFSNVEWQAGEIRAVASNGGTVVAAQTKRTAGAPVALRLTPITGPGGLQADGADILLIDVEAVDAQGNRCPTFQQPVDFEVDGPGVWRGGYNSGKLDSINHTRLDLEAGINRVAVRATRSPGLITVRARAEGLLSGSVAVASQLLAAVDGTSGTLPVMPAASLPTEAPVYSPGTVSVEQGVAGAKGPPTPGRFVKAFNYSGPSYYIVHVETRARDGKNAYVDVDSAFVSLPAVLAGADWVQAANRESLYHAVDLMQLEVPGGAVVTIAHDDRLPRPPWMTAQFQETPEKMQVLGRAMTLFRRDAERDESLTLGANTEDSTAKEANMYLVFVNVLPR